MQTGEFVAAFREAFGPVPELPLLFRYTDEPLRPAAKAGGCFFKALAEARDGRPVGLNASNIGCGGGKFYTGFSPMPEFVPQFVSLKERYKQTPEMVLDFIAALDLRPGPKAWLEFVRVDAAGTFDGAEGVLFFATPDVLAGLVTWAGFDNDAPDAVAAPFGSGSVSYTHLDVYKRPRYSRAVDLRACETPPDHGRRLFRFHAGGGCHL